MSQVDTPDGRRQMANAINTIAAVAEITFGEKVAANRPKWLPFSVRDGFAISVIDELNRQGWILVPAILEGHKE